MSGAKSVQLTYLEAIRQGIQEEMRRDPDVFLLGEDIGVYGGAFKVTAGMLDEFGERRVIDTPISESAIVGAAIGASLMGLRPVAEMQFADFITCGYDQIVNFAAKCRYRWGAAVPMVIRAPSGGGIHGGPFHSQNPEAWFTHTPGLKVVAPSTPADAKGLIKSAIRDNDPVLYFEHKALYRRIKEEVPDGDFTVPIGQAAVVREGRDLSIITYGAMVHVAREAAEALENEGISVEIVDLRTLAPLDEDTVLASVRKTSKVLLLHEDTMTGGIGGELAARIAQKAFEYLDGPIVRLTAPDTPVPYSPPLEEAFLPNATKLVEAARSLARY
ncbi:MAG: alpha-ketoacid dehydrogenase subunit beta [Acidobacteriia bacterium]|nr:alpha-ketoacid dehydrogenase subunit beta [Terriglobia bacterium]